MANDIKGAETTLNAMNNHAVGKSSSGQASMATGGTTTTTNSMNDRNSSTNR
jgi:hypothetical protein